MSISVASAALNALSSGVLPPPAAGAEITGSATIGEETAAAGAACAAATSEAVAVAASSTTSSAVASSCGRSMASSAKTVARSRSTLRTSIGLPAYCGKRKVWPNILAKVGDEPTPISTKRSTPKPAVPAPAVSLVPDNSRSWVSIHRTGDANCHARSSMSKVRPSCTGFSSAFSKSARISLTYFESTTSAIASTNSRLSSNGRATKFGI